MKASRLEIYFQKFIQNMVIEKREYEEVGLGFDTMLSHDVVKFLLTDHGIVKPLLPRIVSQQAALDEHELAMV